MSDRPQEIDEAWMNIVNHYKNRAAEIEKRLGEEIELLRSANTSLDGWLEYQPQPWATHPSQTLAGKMNYQIGRLERLSAGVSDGL